MKVLGAQEVEDRMGDLCALLQDAVADGASIGFIEVPSEDEARGYWNGVIERIQTGAVVLLAAFDGERVVGSIQIGLEPRANGNHRGELMKLFVLRSHRRHGRARALILAATEEARERGRQLLVMDTRKGGDAERLCQSLGFVRYGEVPRYARSTAGQLQATAFFYVWLGKAQ